MPEMLAAETNFVIAGVVQAIFIDRIVTLYQARPWLARGIAVGLGALSVSSFALGSEAVAWTASFATRGNQFDTTSAAYKWRCVLR